MDNMLNNNMLDFYKEQLALLANILLDEQTRLDKIEKKIDLIIKK